MINIAQMTQYRMKYLQDRNAEDKEKMYKHAFFKFLLRPSEQAAKPSGSHLKNS